MELKQKITNLLTTNKISTTEVCDVMGKVGNLEGIRPVNQGLYAAGEVFYSFAHDETNFDLHRQLEKIEKNQIAFIDSIDCGNRAVIGDLVAKYLLLYKGAKGVVTNGYMRDANELIKQRRYVWCSGLTPIGCHNHNKISSEKTAEQVQKRKKNFENSILVCDDSGTCLIEEEFINDDLIRKLEYIELQEDIWYFCIDTLKWSTYETVALKRYLEEPELLPKIFRDKLLNLDP